jgi:ribonuclease J
MGECTQHIYEARLQGMRKSFDTNTEGQIIKPFRTGDTIRIGNVEVQPYHVDHSIPAAYGFLIHCSECSIVYSGDFRRHGTRPDLTQDFIDAVQKAGQPDVLLCEGTNIAKAELANEAEVHQKATTIISECKSLAIADFSETDFDRFRTMQSVAHANDRELVIEPRRMWVVHALNQCRELDAPSIAHDLSIRWFDAEKKRKSKYEKLLQEVDSPIDEFADRAVTAEDLHKTPRRYIVCSSFGSISTIQRIKPPESGIYLLSASEPFNEESEISFDKLLNWLALQGLAMYTVHCSGHVHPIHLFQTIEEISPKQLIPIHTEHPQLYKRFIHASGVRVKIPKQATPIHLG